jgi:hypothetical protein
VSDRIPTLADLCTAIADGHVPASVDGSVYQVNVLELRRYFQALHSSETQSSLLSSLSQLGTWSSSSRPSVA